MKGLFEYENVCKNRSVGRLLRAEKVNGSHFHTWEEISADWQNTSQQKLKYNLNLPSATVHEISECSLLTPLIVKSSCSI